MADNVVDRLVIAVGYKYDGASERKLVKELEAAAKRAQAAFGKINGGISPGGGGGSGGGRGGGGGRRKSTSDRIGPMYGPQLPPDWDKYLDDEFIHSVNAMARLAPRMEPRIKGLSERLFENAQAFGTQAATIASEVVPALGILTVALGSLTVAESRAVAAESRLAEGLGITTQTLQTQAGALSVYNLDLNDTADIYTTLSDRAADAMSGQQSFIDDFALLGISVDELRGKDPAGLLETVFTEAGNVEDSVNLAAGAVRIFGDDVGRRLITGLSRGGDELARLSRLAKETGVSTSEEAAKGAEDLTFGLSELSLRASGLTRRFALGLAPSMSRIIRRTNEWADANQGVIGQQLDKVTYGIGRAFEMASTPAGKIATDVGIVASSAVGIRATKDAIDMMPGPLKMMMASLGSGAKRAGMFALAIAGVAAAIDEVRTTAEGGDSAIRRLADALGAGEQVERDASGLLDLVNETTTALVALTKASGNAVSSLGDLLGGSIISEEQRQLALQDGMSYLPSARGTAYRFATGAEAIQADMRNFTSAVGEQGLGGIAGTFLQGANDRMTFQLQLEVGHDARAISEIAGQRIQQEVENALTNAQPVGAN